MKIKDRLRFAVKASFLHLLASAFIGLVLWCFVIRRWYPYPYDRIAGGLTLLGLVYVVDVVCGPLLTLIAFNPVKSRRELLTDLSVIGAIQLGALFYGIYSVAEARPAVVAFEVDRFVAVPAAGVDINQLDTAPDGMRTLSWSGPRLIGTRMPRDADEQLQALQLSMQGLEISARPDWWEPYEASRTRVRNRMKPLAELRSRVSSPERAAIDAAVQRTGRPIEDLHYLPATGQQRTDFIALLNADGDVLDFANVDAFVHMANRRTP